LKDYRRAVKLGRALRPLRRENPLSEEGLAAGSSKLAVTTPGGRIEEGWPSVPHSIEFELDGKGCVKGLTDGHPRNRGATKRPTAR
jgi:hypothetical protein